MQIYVLLLPLHLLFLIMFSSLIVLRILFMCLYLLDMDRLYIPKDQASQQKSSLVDSLFELAGKDQFKIFIFSLLLSTLLGFTRVDMRSSYNLLVANLNTLLAQLIFVFISGAGNSELSSSYVPAPLLHLFNLHLFV